MRPVLFIIALALMSACSTTTQPASPPAAAPAPASSTKVTWRTWESAFAEAKRDNKLVFVDAGIEGCTACRWMHEITLRDPRVIAKLEQSFVSVSIDADVQPDLGSRFEEWGWPALVFLDGDGKIVRAIRGNKVPDNFLPILDALTSAGAASAARDREASAAEGNPCELARVRFERQAQNPGGSRIVSASPVLLDLASDKPEQVARALATVDGHTKVIDPVWGGVFVGTHTATWDEGLIPEKRTDHQAWALRTFAAAYAVRRGDGELAAAKHVDRYMREMMSTKDGTFYSTQQDRPASLPSGMTELAYFQLDDAQRRAIGVPPIDHGVYTDQNARMIEAYAAMADATGDAMWNERATRAANALLASRMHADGYVLQATAADADVQGDVRKRARHVDERPYLKANAAFGKALVALHSSTGDAAYLAAADRIARALALLEDAEGGGFYATTARATDGAATQREKPYADNVAAARFLLALSQLHHDDALRDRAARALRAVVTNAAIAELGPTSLAETLLALDDLGRGVVDVSVTFTDENVATARALVAASRAAPGTKLVRLDVEGRYPKSKVPTAFVCTRNTCSRPLSDATQLTKEIARAQRTNGECPIP